MEELNYFQKGIWFAVQHLVLSEKQPEMALRLIEEVGMTLKECMKSADRFQSKDMDYFIKEYFGYKGKEQKKSNDDLYSFTSHTRNIQSPKSRAF